MIKSNKMSLFTESINKKDGIIYFRFGKSLYEYIVKSSQTELGMESSWSNPAGDKVEFLCC